MYLYAAIAALPILFTIIFMAVFNWPAKRALPFSWLIACLVAGFVWKMDFLYYLYGCLQLACKTCIAFLLADRLPGCRICMENGFSENLSQNNFWFPKRSGNFVYHFWSSSPYERTQAVWCHGRNQSTLLWNYA